MDVERYLLSSALTGVISQKLARKLCPKCKVLRPTTPYEKEVFQIVLGKEVNQIYEAGKCDNCTDGYHGRIAIEEVLYINDTLRSVIANPNTTKEELKELVYTNEVTTLLGDGLEKIINGDTTFTEIFKLIEVDLELKALKEDALKRNKKISPEIKQIQEIKIVQPVQTPTVNPTAQVQEIKLEEPNLVLNDVQNDSINMSYIEDDFPNNLDKKHEHKFFLH